MVLVDAQQLMGIVAGCSWRRRVGLARRARAGADMDTARLAARAQLLSRSRATAPIGSRGRSRRRAARWPSSRTSSWDARRRRAGGVARRPSSTGAEPTLEAHFFAAVAPQLDRALADGDHGRVAAHRAAPRLQDQRAGASRGDLGAARPLRALAHDGAAVTAAAASQPLQPRAAARADRTGRGSGARVPRRRARRRTPAALRHRAGAAGPEGLTRRRCAPAQAVGRRARAPHRRAAATNYRRWTNHAWAVVETRRTAARRRTGPRPTGARLDALVDAGARARAVDPLLHAERPSAERREGWTAATTSAAPPRSRPALAGGHRRRGRLHRHRPVRSVQRTRAGRCGERGRRVSGARATGQAQRVGGRARRAARGTRGVVVEVEAAVTQVGEVARRRCGRASGRAASAGRVQQVVADFVRDGASEHHAEPLQPDRVRLRALVGDVDDPPRGLE